ncbi:squalene/phytoene synthase family protein [Kitasatospora sp. CM 4170]|uniref:Phytoene/squalene synthase family protein n=1 Tax=Kitasatospora aburaviensis TaxID=67265 RepID=A0ABW1F584_9ACTN|nr:squalene/phytoene synthase family protein [Kitasatospora sp. CM 4170]WNM49111.1 squalene/phytoene synthase family protein [Kitasatospora sp. CM 4170]
MGSWESALDAAGITDPGLREDYSRQRRQVTQYKREAVLAARLLLPAPVVPHVIAATAYMHRTDSLLDSGPLDERKAAYARWEQEVADGLATGGTDNPELRPLLNTAAAHPTLHDRALEHLAGALTDLDFTGFATEADYQHYVDAYSLPAFMVVATLLGPDGDQTAYRAACRTFIDAGQRLDFVSDLAEDLADGRLTVPEQTLDRHGVTRADLEQARDLPAVRAMITEQLDLVDRTLAEGRAVAGLVPPAHRPMVRCLIGLDELTSAAARADVPALMRRSAGPSKPAALRLLGREYLRARRVRR